MIFIYRLLTSVIVWPFSLAVRNHPNFKNTIRQRLARKLPSVPAGDLIWFHGSSLGEIRALAGLIENLKEQRPETVICLSSMTATGRRAAMEIKSADIVIPQPFDVHAIMKRYMRHLAPKALIIAETEIWPNMLAAARKNHVPVIIINARLSLKAFKRYRYVKPLLRYLLENVRILAMASEDYSRFKTLEAANVARAGNIKFDIVTELKSDRVETLKEELGIGVRPVFIAGSIRSGEEEPVVVSIEEIRKKIPEIFCIVAPRHLDRISYVTDAAVNRGMTWSFRSHGQVGADILILDTVGELFDFYGLSTVAFVGGSLVRLGGQNPLEPIAWGVPTLHGPAHGRFSLGDGGCGRIHYHGGDACGARPGGHFGHFSHPERYRQKARMATEALDGARGVTRLYCDEILRIISS